MYSVKYITYTQDQTYYKYRVSYILHDYQINTECTDSECYTQYLNRLSNVLHIQKKNTSVYDQEIPQSHTAGQPTSP